MKYSLIILAAILCSTVSAQSFRTLKNVYGKYSISIPENWIEKTEGSTTDAYAPDVGDMDEWKEFVGVSVAEANGLTLEEAFTFYITQDFPGYYPKFAVVKKGDETIGGLKAKWVLYSFSNSSVAGSQSSATLYNIFYLVLKGDRLYSLNGIAEQSHYPTYENDYLSVIRSFRITL
jgi:hypothetical protein